jgi:hypothetical protein
MIGIGAITGGLIGLGITLVATGLGLAGIAGGGIALKRRRRALGLAMLLPSVALLSYLATVLWKVFVPSEATLLIDMGRSSSNPLASIAHNCMPVPDSMVCFAKVDAIQLTVVFPDGHSKTFDARSLYTDSKDGLLRKIAFMSSPTTATSDVLQVMDAQLSLGPAGDIQNWSDVRDMIASGQHFGADLTPILAYPGYDVRLWILPRDRGSKRVAYWYEIHRRSESRSELAR